MYTHEKGNARVIQGLFFQSQQDLVFFLFPYTRMRQKQVISSVLAKQQFGRIGTDAATVVHGENSAYTIYVTCSWRRDKPTGADLHT